MDIDKATTSMLRAAVRGINNTLAPTSLTRNVCLRFLRAHDIHKVSVFGGEQGDRVYQPQMQQRDMSQQNDRAFVLNPNHNYYTISDSAVLTTDRVNAHFTATAYPGATDVIFNKMEIRDTLSVPLRLIYDDTDVVSYVRETMDEIRAINTEMEIMRSELNTMKSNIEYYESNQSIKMAVSNTYEFVVVQNVGNVEYVSPHAEYNITSFVVTMRNVFTLNSITSSQFSIRLPFPIKDDALLTPLFRVYIKTATGHFSTVGTVSHLPSNPLEICVASHLFTNIDPLWFPMEIQIEGKYLTSEDSTGAYWVTPMRFDLVRNMYMVPQFITIADQASSITFIKGAMQWNVIEERVEFVTHSTYYVTSGNEYEWTIDIPDSNTGVMDTRINTITGYGSAFLIPTNQFTIDPPEVSVNTKTKKMRVRLKIHGNINVEHVQISTHVVYYNNNYESFIE